MPLPLLAPAAFGGIGALLGGGGGVATAAGLLGKTALTAGAGLAAYDIGKRGIGLLGDDPLGYEGVDEAIRERLFQHGAAGEAEARFEQVLEQRLIEDLLALNSELPEDTGVLASQRGTDLAALLEANKGSLGSIAVPRQPSTAEIMAMISRPVV